MNDSKEIRAAVEGFLQEVDWKYDVDEESGAIITGVTLENKLESVAIVIYLRDDKYLVHTAMKLEVDEKNRGDMARLLNRLNCDLIFGNFEMHEDDGLVRFRFAVDCDGCLPSREVVRDSIFLPVKAFEECGDAILRVLQGTAAAKEAYDSMAEK